MCVAFSDLHKLKAEVLYEWKISFEISGLRRMSSLTILTGDKCDHFNWSKIPVFFLSAMVSKIFDAVLSSEKFLTMSLEPMVLN